MATEIYRVKSGESLSSIARDMLGDMQRWPELAFLNGIAFPYFIHPGQVLELPPETGGDIIEVISDKPVMLYVSKPRVQSATAPTTIASVPIRPATVILLVVGAVLLFFNRS